MDTESEVERNIDSLIKEFPELIKLINKKDAIMEFGIKYQSWYSRALKLVELLGPDRLEEFISYYRINPKRKSYNGATYVIQDYVNGMGANIDMYEKPLWDIHNTAGVRFLNQMQILSALRSRLSGVLSDVKGSLLAQIQDDELKVAQKLIKITLRGAGAIAGVVLEGHLQRLAENHKVVISKKDPTISELNDPLKSSGVYDIIIWRKIQHMADIRNICDHNKGREPIKSEVEELIIGVNSIINTVQ
jgi:hypothetical protein